MNEEILDFVRVQTNVSCILNMFPNEKSIYSFLFDVVKNGTMLMVGKICCQNVLIGIGEGNTFVQPRC
jgi:hypothetical protein